MCWRGKTVVLAAIIVTPVVPFETCFQSIPTTLDEVARVGVKG